MEGPATDLRPAQGVASHPDTDTDKYNRMDGWNYTEVFSEVNELLIEFFQSDLPESLLLVNESVAFFSKPRLYLECYPINLKSLLLCFSFPSAPPLVYCVQ